MIGRLAAVALCSAAAFVFPLGARAQAPPIEHAPEQNPAPKTRMVPGVPLSPGKPDMKQDPVGFIDSGIDADHPQLKGLVVASRDFTGEGLMDDFFHGTAVALTFLQGLKDGELPPPLISAKVIGRKTVSPAVTAARMVDAIAWLSSQHVMIVNISMALSGNAAVFAPLCKAMQEHSKMLFGIAAGNGGPKDVVYPASCAVDNKIVTGAVTEDGKLAADSGKGDIYANGSVELLEPYEYHRRAGERLANEGKFEAAEKEYQQALESSPPVKDAAKIDYGLGYVAWKTDKADPAMERFRAAIKADPHMAEAYFAASVILTGRKDYQGAYEMLEGALAAGADSARIRDRLARVLMDLDRPAEAEQQIEALRKLDAKFEGLDELAQDAHNRALLLTKLAGGADSQQLFWALERAGDPGLVAFLLRHSKPDLDAVPEGAKVPPIVRAAASGQPAMVEVLLGAGGKVDARNPGNRITALMTAANAGDARIVNLLLEAGAALNAVDDFGYTPLMFSAEQGRDECAEILLKHGADLASKSQEGKTALDYARQHGHERIATEIEAAQTAGHK